MRAVVKRRLTGETLFEVGGPWDRADHCYLPAKGTPGKVFYLNESQIEAARAIGEWIVARGAVAKRVIELVLEGARGSGKSHLGVLAVFWIAIAFPGARCWLVPPANTRRRELEIIIRGSTGIPASWRAWKEQQLTYTLPNLSTVTFIGADDQDALKQGGYEVCLLNEAQLMKREAYVNAIAGVRNVEGRPKGLLLLAMNYSATVRGDWTWDHFEKIDAGEVNARRFVLDPSLNTSIDADTNDEVYRAIASVSKDDAEREIHGVRIRPGDFACSAFKPQAREKGGHVGRPPEIGWFDTTRAATAPKTPRDTGFPLVAIVDFQRRPGCNAIVCRVYQREDKKPVYVVEKALGQEGDLEDDTARRIIDYAAEWGYRASDVLVIADSTGHFQNHDHSPRAKPSHQVLREWGLTVIPPEYRRKADGSRGEGYNGDVPDSLALFHQVCTEERFLVDPSLEWVIESLRRCKVKRRGGSLRLDDAKPGYSHWVDVCRYFVWALEPRRGPKRTGGGWNQDAFNQLRSAKLPWSST